MYTRFTVQFYEKLILFGLLCRSRSIYTLMTPSYQQFSTIIPKSLTSNPIQSLYFSNLSHQDSNIMACKGNRKVLNIDHEQLLEAQKDNNVLIIDVREQSEIDETGKLPGSIHIPMNDVSNILQNLPEKNFEKKYGKRKPTKDTKIILSCRSGKRSGTVQETLQKLGYENAYNYIGGWMEWESKQKT